MKTYHTQSGQTIRQNQDLGINTVIIDRRETDYVERTNTEGADSFTNEMWATDTETIKRWCKDWAYNPDDLEFEIN